MRPFGGTPRLHAVVIRAVSRREVMGGFDSRLCLYLRGDSELRAALDSAGGVQVGIRRREADGASPFALGRYQACRGRGSAARRVRTRRRPSSVVDCAAKWRIAKTTCQRDMPSSLAAVGYPLAATPEPTSTFELERAWRSPRRSLILAECPGSARVAGFRLRLGPSSSSRSFACRRSRERRRVIRRVRRRRRRSW